MSEEKEIDKQIEDLQRQKESFKEENKVQNKIDELERKIKELEVIPESQSTNNEKPNKSKKTKEKESWWSKFFSGKKLKKPNVVAVIYLRNNGNAEMMEVESKNEMFSIHGKTYHERNDCIYTVTKDRIPMAIIPEWSLIPIGTKRWEDHPMLEKFSQLEEHVLKGIRHAELVRRDGQESKPISTKQMIFWVIIAIVAGAILINYV